ncbi:hypothetical protein ABZ942_42220 [Nocardia sp. NPDC046473]|uniref:aromatic-ring hydroxylase C-terminal domain-containing protein n=1 Tax=Nocardia sp. NPDC046473 TaxID=3155733 RepID=UPI0033C26EA0
MTALVHGRRRTGLLSEVDVHEFRRHPSCSPALYGQAEQHISGRRPFLGRLVAATSYVPADALLIRPDGYIAWAADGSDPSGIARLEAAITRWFGSVAR